MYYVVTLSRRVTPANKRLTALRRQSKIFSVLLLLRSSFYWGRSLAFKAYHRRKERFHCPLCDYSGPFIDLHARTGTRESALCPRCSSLERHRLQLLTLTTLEKSHDFARMDAIHFAPESFLTKRLRRVFRSYTTADLSMPRVDHQVDLTRLPFRNASYDLVYASHVLEHIKEDMTAIREIRRILRPNGLAILPVPIVGDRTVEYAEPNPVEAGHVRAPGLDYYERYRKVFSDVKVFSSDEFEPTYQVFVYEDRSHWPTPEMPLRLPSPGVRHADFVPVCLV